MDSYKLRVALTMPTRTKHNRKIGLIPYSITSAHTCPDACPLKPRAADGSMKGSGCYATQYPLRGHWDAVTAGDRGTDWATFCAKIAALPAGQMWRHNQAGDLPGDNNAVDAAALQQLVDANAGKRSFTYTHKPATAENVAAMRSATEAGFTVNLSANTLAQADQLAETGLPVVVIQDAPDGERSDTVTPAGRKVATCPATYRDDVTCASCGLCQRVNRKVIVGFPAHGRATKGAALRVVRGAA